MQGDERIGNNRLKQCSGVPRCAYDARALQGEQEVKVI